MANRPLVTFAIAAFNQERFIAEAVQAAFAQTYSPLEIILSDDCSEDQTFEIMRSLAGDYHGPHNIILNRNPARRSLGGHINRIVEISHGELIVGAAGDDVSLPERTQRTHEIWERSGRQATSIHSTFLQIDEGGRPIEKRYQTPSLPKGQYFLEQKTNPLAYVRTLEPCIFGCTHAFSRNLFRSFGNLPEAIIHEDNALGFRSVLAGRVVYINEPLVKYRLHCSNVFMTSNKRIFDLKSLHREEEKLRRYFQNREAMYAGFLPDLKRAEQLGLVATPEFQATFAEATRLGKQYSLLGEFLESSFPRKCAILVQLWRSGLDKTGTKVLLRRLLPRPVLLRVRLARSYAALALSRSP